MTSDDINKHEFLVRNLPTRSVTLYPTKAQIIRDIAGISLKVRLEFDIGMIRG